jgi:hypothetical protein
MLRNTRSKLMNILFHLLMTMFTFLFLIRFSSDKQTYLFVCLLNFIEYKLIQQIFI